MLIGLIITFIGIKLLRMADAGLTVSEYSSNHPQRKG